MTFQEKSSALTDSDTNLLTGKEKVTLTYFCIMYRLKWLTQILSVETSANFYPSSIINHILQVLESNRNISLIAFMLHIVSYTVQFFWICQNVWVSNLHSCLSFLFRGNEFDVEPCGGQSNGLQHLHQFKPSRFQVVTSSKQPNHAGDARTLRWGSEEGWTSV